ncbi:MAG: serine/threonine protein kinase [Candidatus Obscuribacterales bacterium]|nr:serine/threonine protein kinase [Candidatus Obscuribacterales bacterium]
MNGEQKRRIANRYEIISKLGEGGTATVYLVRDETLNRDVALKLLNPDLVKPESALRFQSEAKTASTLAHPNLINVLDFGIADNNEIYLVMDYIKGITLAEFVEQNGPMPIEEAIEIFIQVCDGIGHAHKQGILHRDLKSTNVMLTEQDTHTRVLVLDFGLAKRTEYGSITRTRKIIGSPLFMSPEHASGHELDGRADIYSLGCLMYYTLTGVYPIQGDTALDTIFKQSTESAPTLKQGMPDKEFSHELETIVGKCLKKDKSQRYSSVQELRTALMSMLEPTQIEQQQSDLSDSLPRKSTLQPVSTTLLGPAVIALVVAIVASTLILFRPNTPPPQVKKRIIPIFSGSDFKTKKWDDMHWNDGIVWSKRWDISDNDLTESQLKDIQYLSLFAEPITAKGLASISHLPLKGLYLKENPLIHDKDLQIVNQMRTLEVLCLDAIGATDVGIAQLKDLKNLRILSLAGNDVTDRIFETIGTFPKLEILYLDHLQNVNGSGLAHLKRLPRLQKLNLEADPNLRSEYLELLGELKSLKELYLCKTRCNGNVLAKLTTLPNLSELDVRLTDIQDKDVPLFSKITSLERLYLDNRKISTKVFNPLRLQTKFKVIEKEHLPADRLNTMRGD